MIFHHATSVGCLGAELFLLGLHLATLQILVFFNTQEESINFTYLTCVCYIA